MLQAVRPVVVGLLLWTAYDMANTVFGAQKLGWGKALAQGWDKLLFVGGAFVLLTFTKINPAIIILVTAALGFILYR
jgi:chromate transport protein ChrA